MGLDPLANGWVVVPALLLFFRISSDRIAWQRRAVFSIVMAAFVVISPFYTLAAVAPGLVLFSTLSGTIMLAYIGLIIHLLGYCIAFIFERFAWSNWLYSLLCAFLLAVFFDWYLSYLFFLPLGACQGLLLLNPAVFLLGSTVFCSSACLFPSLFLTLPLFFPWLVLWLPGRWSWAVGVFLTFIICISWQAPAGEWGADARGYAGSGNSAWSSFCAVGIRPDLSGSQDSWERIEAVARNLEQRSFAEEDKQGNEGYIYVAPESVFCFDLSCSKAGSARIKSALGYKDELIVGGYKEGKEGEEGRVGLCNGAYRYRMDEEAVWQGKKKLFAVESFLSGVVSPADARIEVGSGEHGCACMGSTGSVLLPLKNGKIACLLLCSELFCDSLPPLVSCADLIICLVNDGWFAGSWVSRVMPLVARMRACQSGKDVVYCGYESAWYCQKTGAMHRLPLVGI
jgi:hypothetical protein